MLSRALKMAFWVSYDHLGKLVAVNLACSALCAVPILAVMAAAPHLSDRAFAVFLIMAGTASFAACFSCASALVWMVRGLIETRDGTVGAFFAGLRRFGLRGGALGLCYLFAGACLLCSMWFYASRVGAAHPVAGYGLGAVAFWAVVLLVMTVPAAVPAMVHKSLGPFSAVKFAALLVAGNPLFFAGVAAYSALIAAAAVLVPVLLVCFALAPLAALHCAAYEMLARKYAALEAARASGGPLRIDFDDANDDYLNRGFRDILFPWKG